MSLAHTSALRILRDSLDDFQGRRMPVEDFCLTWRTQAATLLAVLPPRYKQVMEDFLARLEASSLFTEESCSFSHEDLLGNLSMWLAKVQQTLAVQP